MQKKEVNRRFFENTRDAMLIGSPDGQVFAANPSACKMLGWNEEEICNLGRKGLVEQTPQLTAGINNRKKTGNFFGELNFVKKDGTRFPVELSSSVFSNSDGLELTTIIFRDITERKKVEQDLGESKSLFNSIIDSTFDMIWAVDSRDFGLLTFNNSFSDYFKNEREIIVKKGDQPKDLLPTEQLKDQWINMYSEALQNGPYKTEYNVSSLSRTLLLSFNVLKRDATIFGISIFGKDITERKNDSEKLLESENRYRSLVELSPTGIAIYQDAVFVYVNNAGLKILGCTKQKQILGKPVISIVHPESRKEVIKRMELVANGVAVPPFEEKLIRLDGSFFDAEVSSIPTTYKENPAGQIIVIDITDRKKAQDELKAKEEKYRTIFDSTGTITLIVEENAEIVMANRECYELSGYSPAELVGQKWTRFVSPESVQEMLQNQKLRRLNPNLAPKKYQANMISRSGEIKNVILDISMIPGSTQSVVSMLDITELKRIELALKRASSYNRSLIEASLDPMVTIGPDGKIMDVNKATQDVTGYSRQKLIGTDFSGYFTDPLKAQAGYEEVFSKGFVRDYLLEIKNKNGGSVPVLYNATLYRDEEGMVTGIFAAARDISDLKKVEEKLEKSANELRELSRHVEDLMEIEKTQIAHDLHDDLGQKLTALNMDISWLKSRIGVQSRTVENKMQLMSQLLIDTFESLRKISYGLRPSILDNLGLYPAIEWLLSEFKKSTGINYSLTFVPKEKEIDNKLSLVVFRIIQESLTNVARHSGATKVTVKIKLAGEKLNLNVIDNGIGFDSAVLKKRPSFGLMGMQERARSYGGEFAIRGKSGEGTVVSLNIPLKTIQ